MVKMVEPFMLKKMLYRMDETGEMLSFGKDKIYKLIESGELIAHCQNGKKTKPVRVVGTSIAEYVARHKIAPAEWTE